MQAVVVSAFGPYQDAQIADIPCPAIAPHEVLIEVRAAPVNFVDLIVIAGKYQFLPKLPFTPGKGGQYRLKYNQSPMLTLIR